MAGKIKRIDSWENEVFAWLLLFFKAWYWVIYLRVGWNVAGVCLQGVVWWMQMDGEGSLHSLQLCFLLSCERVFFQVYCSLPPLLETWVEERREHPQTVFIKTLTFHMLLLSSHPVLTLIMPCNHHHQSYHQLWGRIPYNPPPCSLSVDHTTFCVLTL